MWEFSPYAPQPVWSAIVAEYSGNLVGVIPTDQIEADSIDHAPVGLTFQTQMFVVPLGWVWWHPIRV
jgi:hypothetical protein